MDVSSARLAGRPRARSRSRAIEVAVGAGHDLRVERPPAAWEATDLEIETLGEQEIGVIGASASSASRRRSAGPAWATKVKGPPRRLPHLARDGARSGVVDHLEAGQPLPRQEHHHGSGDKVTRERYGFIFLLNACAPCAQQRLSAETRRRSSREGRSGGPRALQPESENSVG